MNVTNSFNELFNDSIINTNKYGSFKIKEEQIKSIKNDEVDDKLRIEKLVRENQTLKK